ncbi:Ada metal-binding domain-containing protein [Oharaeibacter diazotrophicus]
MFFADADTAAAAGFRPCARCLTDAYRAWRAARGAASGGAGVTAG